MNYKIFIKIPTKTSFFVKVTIYPTIRGNFNSGLTKQKNRNKVVSKVRDMKDIGK